MTNIDDVIPTISMLYNLTSIYSKELAYMAKLYIEAEHQSTLKR
jgi:hypothetical protein